MQSQPLCKMSFETRYVRPGCPADTTNPDDFCIYKIGIGVQDKGFKKVGRLSVPEGKRPNLIVGQSVNAYAGKVQIADSVRKDHRSGVVRELLRMGVGNAVWLGALVFGVGALTFPVTVSMAIKSAVIGSGWASAMAFVDYLKATREYRGAVQFLESLNDMVKLMHTGKFASWMFNAEQIHSRYEQNPDAFNQATAELMGLGIELPWAIREEQAQAITPELALPPLPEVPDAVSAFTRLPARGAA